MGGTIGKALAPAEHATATPGVRETTGEQLSGAIVNLSSAGYIGDAGIDSLLAPVLSLGDGLAIGTTLLEAREAAKLDIILAEHARRGGPFGHGAVDVDHDPYRTDIGRGAFSDGGHAIFGFEMRQRWGAFNAWRSDVLENILPSLAAPEQAALRADIDQRYHNLQVNQVYVDELGNYATGEVNKLLFVGIGAPALIAGGMVAAPAAAGYAGSFYVGGTASTIASGSAGFATGGLFGAGFEFSKNEAFGLEHTAGGYTTAILAGGVGGSGLRLLPNTVLGRAVSTRAQTIGLGGASGFTGDFAGQLVTNGGNRSQISYTQLGLATVQGGGLGAVMPLDVRISGFTSGRNSSLSIYQGLNTKLNSGNIVQTRLRYPVNAGAANAVVGSGRQAVGTLIDGMKQRGGR